MIELIKMHKKLENNTLNEFRILVRKALLLDKKEEQLFYTIPESFWEKVFKINYNNDLSYANKVILGTPEPIVHKETRFLERVKSNIDNYDYSISLLKDHIDNNKKVIFITDFDNDGSISQAIIKQLHKTLPKEKQKNIIIEYARTVKGNNNRGFTFELLEEVANQNQLYEQDDFLIVTADNGINSRSEQIKINKHYPNAHLLITDHHIPEKDMVIQENEKTTIFNPKYNSFEYVDVAFNRKRGNRLNNDKKESQQFFKEYNISGASTIGLLISAYIKDKHNLDNLTLEEQVKLVQTGHFGNELKIINDLSKISNMLDYVETAPADKPYDIKEINKALDLQRLLNINNSSNKMINTLLNHQQISLLNNLKNIDNDNPFDGEVLLQSNQHLMSLNVMAKGLLSLVYEYDRSNESEKENMIYWSAVKGSNLIDKRLKEIISGDYVFQEHHYLSKNENYIEQLRPYIFEYMVDDTKSIFHKQLLEAMVNIYEKMEKIEHDIVKELRKVNLTQDRIEDNVIVSLVPKDLQSIFNRKLLNKAYNRSNNGLNLSLDSIKSNVVSGSFRSIYPISEILNKNVKKDLERTLGIKIETPGHEMAAGFIMTKKRNCTLDFDKANDVEILIKTVAEKLNESIGVLKLEQSKTIHEESEYLLTTDLMSVETIDKINKIIRGNVAYFAKLIPVVKLTENDLVLNDSKTSEQVFIADLLSKNETHQTFGWITLQVQLQGKHTNSKSILIPSGVLKEVIDSNYEMGIKLNYLNNGAFIGEKASVSHDNVIKLSQNNDFIKELNKYYQDVQKTGQHIQYLNREDLQDVVFFKFNRYGKEDFSRFENLIINIIDENKVDCYSIFDTEADGFAYARLINFGTMNYFVDEDLNNGITFKLSQKEYEEKKITGVNEREYLLSKKDFKKLRKVDVDEFAQLRQRSAMSLFMGKDDNYVYEGNDLKGFLDGLTEIKNKKIVNDEVIVNRTLRGESFSFLVRPDDFVISTAISKLTGIDNEMAMRYGHHIDEIDNFLKNYYGKQKNLFIAHNTSYDGRIALANLPKFSELLVSENNFVADSASFSKSMNLMYDNIPIVKIDNVAGLANYYFYNNIHSDVNLNAFFESPVECEYPDVKNQIHLVKTFNSLTKEPIYHIRDMKTNILTHLHIDSKTLYLKDNKKTANIVVSDLPLNLIGYNAQGLGEMKQIRQMLLENEDFKPVIYDDFSAYDKLEKNKVLQSVLLEMQSFYRFNQSEEENLDNLYDLYPAIFDMMAENPELKKEVQSFIHDFIEKNRHIENQFNESWYHRMILSQYEPTLQTDLNATNFDILSKLTGLDKNVVENVLSRAYLFKRKHKEKGMVTMMTDEAHMNGPVKGLFVGDVAFEDKATMLLFIDRLRNPMSNDIDKMVSVFNQHMQEFNFKFKKQQYRLPAIDTMSFKQHAFFVKRDNVSKTIQTIANHENQVLNDVQSHSLVKFNLGEEYLQTGKNIYAVTKLGVSLSNEQINEDAKKLAFVMAINQLSNVESNGNLGFLLKDNYNKLKQYRDDLMERYDYIEMNESEKMVSDYHKIINQFLLNEVSLDRLSGNNVINPAKRKGDSSGLDCVACHQFDNIQEILLGEFKQELYKMNINEDEIKEILNKNINNEHQNLSSYLSDYLLFLDNIQFGEEHEIMSLYNSEETIREIKFDDYLPNIIKSDFVGDEHTRLHKVMTAMLINSLAIMQKRNNPTRLENALNGDFPTDVIEHDGFRSPRFLSNEHSNIKRNNATSHLFKELTNDLMEITQHRVVATYLPDVAKARNITIGDLNKDTEEIDENKRNMKRKLK